MDLGSFAFHLGCVCGGYVFAVSLEWFVHNIFFHRMGKKKGSRFGFHYNDHHRAVRKTKGHDASFGGSRFAWNGYGREFWGIVIGSALLSPFLLVAPLFWLTVVVCGVHYHVVHTRSHLDVEWCRTHLRWHWDHHMGKNPDVNWGVTTEWFDRMMGTREVWLSKAERAALAESDAPTRAQAAR